MSNWNYPTDLLEAAWGLIANAFEGDWDKAIRETCYTQGVNETKAAQRKRAGL